MIFVGFLFVALGFIFLQITVIAEESLNLKFFEQSENINTLYSKRIVYFNNGTDGVEVRRAPASPYNDIRLPRNILPISYKLDLHPNFTASSSSRFSGKVEILLQCKKATPYVILHQKQLKIKRHSLTGLDNRNMEIKRTSMDKKYQQYIIESSSVLTPAKKYVLIVEFEGELSTIPAGIFKSSYKSNTGEIRYLVATQFEPTYARSAFPCFDEPEFKANFTITLTHHPEYTALSNMPVKKRIVRKDGFVQSCFQESVKMSTYLVAFVLCDFKHKYKVTKTGKLVRVWSRPGAINKTSFALQVANKTLSYYEDFFGISYPLHKLDLIGIPGMSGAMENWGLVTFSESALLYDATSSGFADQLKVAMVINHELAHQWFGNLVTMDWWDDLWLNEGFAVFVEYLGTDHFAKDWRRLDQFMTDTLQGALDADSLHSTHPVSTRVRDPAQINEIVDVISYHKGSSIIRMLRSFVGEQKFREGLKLYLRSHAFANTKARDLWNSFTKVCNNLEVGKIMRGWVEQKGFPLVTFNTNSAQKRGSGRRVEISQKTFVRNSKISREVQKDSESRSSSWYIPVDYVTQLTLNNPRTIWLNKTTTTYVQIPGWTKWIKANAGQSGFYRVNYDQENWKSLSTQLKAKHQVMPPLDRSGLLDDAFNLARAGYLPIATALEMTSYLHKEHEYVPWATVMKSLNYVSHMLCSRNDTYRLYQPYVLKKLKALEKKLGWINKGSMDQRLLRRIMLMNLCSYGDANCVKKAKLLFEAWMRDERAAVAPYLRDIVYRTSVIYGDKHEWNFLWQKRFNSQDASEREKIIIALSATSDQELLTKLLNQTLQNTTRLPDMLMTIVAVAGTPNGRSLVLKFLTKHLRDIIERTGKEGRELRVILAKTTEHLNDLNHLKKVKDLFASHKHLIPRYSPIRSKVLENIENNITWLTMNANDVKQWLVRQKKREENQKSRLDYIKGSCPGLL